MASGCGVGAVVAVAGTLVGMARSAQRSARAYSSPPRRLRDDDGAAVAVGRNRRTAVGAVSVAAGAASVRVGSVLTAATGAATLAAGS